MAGLRDRLTRAATSIGSHQWMPRKRTTSGPGANPAPSMAPSTTLDPAPYQGPLGGPELDPGQICAAVSFYPDAGRGQSAARSVDQRRKMQRGQYVSRPANLGSAWASAQARSNGGPAVSIQSCRHGASPHLNALSSPRKQPQRQGRLCLPRQQRPPGRGDVLQQFLNNWQQGGGHPQGRSSPLGRVLFNALKGNRPDAETGDILTEEVDEDPDDELRTQLGPGPG